MSWSRWVRVAVGAAAPAYRGELEVALEEAGLRVERPADVERWAGLPGPRAVVSVCRGEVDVSALTRLRRAGTAVVGIASGLTVAGYRDALRAGFDGAVDETASLDAIVQEVCGAAGRQGLRADDVVRATARALAGPEGKAVARGRVTVLAADAQPLYRQALAGVVRSRPDLELVGERSDGRAALDAIVALEPDVAVLDVALPGLDGVRVLNAACREGVSTRVVLLAAHIEQAAVYAALGAGAAAYLTKEADGREVCETITAVAGGRVVLAPQLQTGIAAEIRLRRSDRRPVLSERERDVLRLVAEGLSAGAIGGTLHLGAATVKTHLQHIYAKLEVGERAAAVARAMRWGLLE